MCENIIFSSLSLSFLFFFLKIKKKIFRIFFYKLFEKLVGAHYSTPINIKQQLKNNGKTNHFQNNYHMKNTVFASKYFFLLLALSHLTSRIILPNRSGKILYTFFLQILYAFYLLYGSVLYNRWIFEMKEI